MVHTRGAAGDRAARADRRLVQGRQRAASASKARASFVGASIPLPSRKIALSLAILLALIFSKFFYTAGLTNYYTFYLIDRFGLSVQSAQIYLFVFLASVALGTVIGGPIGDRMGRKFVMWFSILGALPFTLALPYANLFWTSILTVLIGVVVGLGLLGHPRLRAGADPRPGRHDLGPVLRPRFRHGGHRRGRARPSCRSHQHRGRLSRVLVPAADRFTDGVPARYREIRARRTFKRRLAGIYWMQLRIAVFLAS